MLKGEAWLGGGGGGTTYIYIYIYMMMMVIRGLEGSFVVRVWGVHGFGTRDTLLFSDTSKLKLRSGAKVYSMHLKSYVVAVLTCSWRYAIFTNSALKGLPFAASPLKRAADKNCGLSFTPQHLPHNTKPLLHKPILTASSLLLICGELTRANVLAMLYHPPCGGAPSQ